MQRRVRVRARVALHVAKKSPASDRGAFFGMVGGIDDWSRTRLRAGPNRSARQRERTMGARSASNQINFRSSAFATAWVLLVTSSLGKLEVMWNVTVRSVMPSILPISSAVFPTALQRNTSRSRSVS